MREAVKAEEATTLRALQEREAHAHLAFSEHARKLAMAYRAAAIALTTRKTVGPTRSRIRGWRRIYKPIAKR